MPQHVTWAGADLSAAAVRVRGPRVCSHVCAGRRGCYLELAGAGRRQKPEAGPGSQSSPSPGLAWCFHHQLGLWKGTCTCNDTLSGFDPTFPLNERDHIFLWPHVGSCVLDLPDTARVGRAPPWRGPELSPSIRSLLLGVQHPVSVGPSVKASYLTVSFARCQVLHFPSALSQPKQ